VAKIFNFGLQRYKAANSMKPEISTNKKRLNIPLIHNYLSNHSYWAKGRTLKLVETSIEHSLCYGIYLEGEQIGFARVVTDHVTIAHICDVFVLEAYRDKGFASILMSEIMNDPSLQDIKRWMLGTKDAHALYRKFGFKEPAHPERWMEKLQG
jgi:predicted GNAT family acetyltransferase